MSTWLCTMFAKCLRLTAERPPRVTRLAVTDLETRDKLLHVRIRRQHARLSDGSWTRRGQPFLPIDRRERRESSRSLSGPIGQGARSPGGRASAASLASGPPPESGEFLLGRTGERIAIRLTGGQDVPGEDHQLAGRGDDRNAAIFPALEFAHKGPKGAGCQRSCNIPQLWSLNSPHPLTEEGDDGA